jgi:hypothetical protein
MLNDETFFDSVLFLPWGRIAIESSAYRVNQRLGPVSYHHFH